MNSLTNCKHSYHNSSPANFLLGRFLFNKTENDGQAPHYKKNTVVFLLAEKEDLLQSNAVFIFGFHLFLMLTMRF